MKAAMKPIIPLLLLLMTVYADAQVRMENNTVLGRSFLPASPTAAMFTIYGQTAVNYFTGTPSISIPLHGISYKDLSVNLGISYQHGNGVKPEYLPGGVGNGWALSSGGVITRISKGIIPVSFPDPQSVQATVNPTSSANWSTPAALQNDIQRPVYMTNIYNQFEEYAYSFCGMSGKFYTDYQNKQHFKTSDGEDLNIEIQLVDASLGKDISLPLEPQVMAPNPVTSQRVYAASTKMQQTPYKFTITDNKGIKYIFGGKDESIEFSRPGRSLQGSKSEIPNDQNGLNTSAVSWFLTSIESPNGYKIDFIYKRDRFYITSQAYCQGLFTQFQSSTTSLAFSKGIPTARLIKSQLINPCYLDKIITPESTVNFYWSIADQQLGYKFHVNSDISVTTDIPSWSPDPYYCDVQFYQYLDVTRASVDNRFPDKLDSFVVVSSTGGVSKSVKFNYTNSTATRLKLNSLEIRGGDYDIAKADIYNFQYNGLALPDYLTFATDTYGYYNGQNLYITSDNPQYYYTNFKDPTWLQNYLSSRAVNGAYNQAEILQRVTYPTGGYTAYEYENNDYGSVAQNWPATVTENAAGTILPTGGVRVSKITNYDFANHKAAEKRYFYKKNYATGGTSSSGVVSYIPQFYETFNGLINPPASAVYNAPGNIPRYTGNMIYYNWGTEPINPMSYNKSSHITYSEVTEMNADNGFTVYRFKNYDNGFADREAINAIYDNKPVSNTWREDDVSSMELERGQVVSEHIYDAGKILKQRTMLDYNDDPDRFSDDGNNMRMLKCIPNPMSSAEYHFSLRYIASLSYTYYPYLKRKTVAYFPTLTDSLVSKTDYSYSGKYRVVEKVVTARSDGDSTFNISKYPQDMVLAGQTVPYQAMEEKHIVDPVVVSQVFKNNVTLLKSTVVNYKMWTGNIFAPSSQQIQIGGNPVETVQQFHNYDTLGNLLEKSSLNDTHEVYIWGYKNLYPIAKIVGSDYNTAVSFINPIIVQNPATSDVAMRNEVMKIRVGLAGTKALVTGYTFSPLGMTSEVDPNNRITYYEYDAQGRLKLVRDENLNVIKVMDYQYQKPLTN